MSRIYHHYQGSYQEIREQIALELAEFIIEDKCTVRDLERIFKISKTTVHNYLTKLLPQIDRELYKEVRAILDQHLVDRYVNGGLAFQRNQRLRREAARKKFETMHGVLEVIE